MRLTKSFSVFLKLFVFLFFVPIICFSNIDKKLNCSHSTNMCYILEYSVLKFKYGPIYWKIPLYQIDGLRMKKTHTRKNGDTYTIALQSNIRTVELMSTQDGYYAKQKLQEETEKLNSFLNHETSTYQFETHENNWKNIMYIVLGYAFLLFGLTFLFYALIRLFMYLGQKVSVFLNNDASPYSDTQFVSSGSSDNQNDNSQDAVSYEKSMSKKLFEQ